MVELLRLGRQHGYDQLTRAMDQALHCGAQDAAAVCYLLTAPALQAPPTVAWCPAEFSYPQALTRELPSLEEYDQLVGSTPNAAQEVA
jgi:hypothetical protein